MIENPLYNNKEIMQLLQDVDECFDYFVRSGLDHCGCGDCRGCFAEGVERRLTNFKKLIVLADIDDETVLPLPNSLQKKLNALIESMRPIIRSSILDLMRGKTPTFRTQFEALAAYHHLTVHSWSTIDILGRSIMEVFFEEIPRKYYPHSIKVEF